MGQSAVVKDVEAGTATQADCLFCQVHDTSINELLVEGDRFYVRWDNYPAAKGHVEIVPKRHVESYFDLTRGEAAEAYDLMKRAQRMLDAKYHPAGYTIGINEGRAAGRTIDHLHIHLIPRYEGDVSDPRGGVRHVLPGTDPDEWSS
ncbi:HIT family protein [Saccharothrix longispora]|uniref:Diadenosine tetraphosphate (Ap4A) HIT family hydrolase n=1 Tax=Saccharothrix longispora TaxID=33920 RepID=A0ABU1Q488_9PSEU|nr:HIT family protein [Saccharothrix longispora]MDR6597343.1 diadenosine tetraphosphate (Ap4A) HIT family hydrolase [Saccharothrix longispora]